MAGALGILLGPLPLGGYPRRGLHPCPRVVMDMPHGVLRGRRPRVVGP